MVDQKLDALIKRRYKKVSLWLMQFEKADIANAAAGLFLRYMALRGAYRETEALADTAADTATFAHSNAMPAFKKLGAARELRRGGGKESGRVRNERAIKWQTDCVTFAKRLVATGTAPRELAGKCAGKFNGRSVSTIRRVLKKAGVK